MAMTDQEYMRFAHAMRDILDAEPDPSIREARRHAFWLLANYIGMERREHPNFDFKRFVEAAGIRG